MRVLFQVLYSVSLYVIDIIIPSVIQGLLLNVRFVMERSLLEIVSLMVFQIFEALYTCI